MNKATYDMLCKIAAGTGDKIKDVLFIWYLFKNQNYVTARQLDQLRDGGVPVYDELNKITGLTDPEIREMADKQQILFNDINTVFLSLTGPDGVFFNNKISNNKNNGSKRFNN